MNAQWLKRRLPLIVICIGIASIIATPLILSALNRKPDKVSKACEKSDDVFNEYAVSQDISLDYQPLSAIIDDDTNTVIVGGTSTALDIFSLVDENQFFPPLNASLGNFHSLAISEEADLLVGGTSSGATVVWKRDSNLEAGWEKNATVLPNGLSGQVAAVAVSRAGTLISASSAGDLFVWRKDEGTNEWNRVRGEFSAHSSTKVLGVAFDEEGKLLSVGNDKQIKVWEPAGDRSPISVYSAQDNIESIVIDTETKAIFAGLKNGVVEVWDADAQKSPELTPSRKLEPHSVFVKSLAISLEDRLLVSGSTDNEVQVWGLCGQTNLQTFREHSDWVNSVDISIEGDTIVSTGIDKRLIIRSR